MLNSPALCCTWSCGSWKAMQSQLSRRRGPRSSEFHCSFLFSLKWGGLLLFQLRLTTSARLCPPVVFTSWFNYLRGTTLLTHGVHASHWRDVRVAVFWQVVCVIHGDPQTRFILKPHVPNPSFCSSKVCLPFHLKSSFTNPLHTPPQSSLFFVPA